MDRIPRIASVQAAGPTQLLVGFEGGTEKIYDCQPLFDRPQFRLLRNEAFFRAVRLDAGGYGVSWSDDLDLSEYELWTNGTIVGGSSCPAAAADKSGC
jgi:hypothetical protein